MRDWLRNKLRNYLNKIHLSFCLSFSLGPTLNYFSSLSQTECQMADTEENDWGQILKCKFKPFDVEKSIYIESQQVASSPIMFAQYICDGLRPGDVPDNLRKLYREAVYGTNSKVKSRIVSRIYRIGGIVRYYFKMVFNCFICFSPINRSISRFMKSS